MAWLMEILKIYLEEVEASNKVLGDKAFNILNI